MDWTNSILISKSYNNSIEKYLDFLLVVCSWLDSENGMDLQKWIY